ncbi:hypothetical protein NEFER03_1981 [Nematocida sp. LUAm3]|nr:hypothetical protein NEFER03_1981 [Nematocida sp. LUAm3]KAI5176065.1 hypothetical protein NEFER02_1899 [Nematocida sp. LUAm2]KAI5177109.1 hypothetical protein NEFER01_0384 [Nematocida sp. LUAm1]
MSHSIDESAPVDSEKLNDYCTLRFEHIKNSSYTVYLKEIKGSNILAIECTDENLAVTFFSYFDMFRVWRKCSNGIAINGHKVLPKIERSSLQKEERERLYLAHAAGATRAVALGNLEDFMTSDFIREEAEKFGMIENFKYLRDKKCCYIEFFLCSSALNFIISLNEDSLFTNTRLSFGKDPYGFTEEDGLPVNNRTLYFGSFPSDLDAHEILRQIHGGRIWETKILKEKKCIFITFLDYVSAAAFLEHHMHTPFVLRSSHVKIGTGKTQPLPFSAATLAYQGVTRCFNIQKDRSFSKYQLEDELSRYGDIERVSESSSFFTVNYLSMQSAYSAYSSLSKMPQWASFLGGYEKDPCEQTTHFSLILNAQKKEFSL